MCGNGKHDSQNNLEKFWVIKRFEFKLILQPHWSRACSSGTKIGK